MNTKKINRVVLKLQFPNKSNVKFLILFFFLAVPFAGAEEDVFRHPIQPMTLNTFSAICAKLAENPVIKGNFEQEKYLSGFNRSLVSSGNFIIAKELGIVWETLRPFPSTMILGYDFIAQKRPDGQKSVMNASGNETFLQLADSLNAVFSGNSRRLLENFDVYFFGSLSDWNIGLLPKDSLISSFAAKITMTGDSVIRSIRIFEQNNDVITYKLLNHSYPAEVNHNEKALFSIQ